MNFLANENIPLVAVDLLRRAGHYVISIIEESPGMKDVDVLKLAIKNKSIILTFDRDYGELIFKYPRFIPQGLIYFRFIPNDPEEPAEILIQIIKQKKIPLLNYFTVVEEDSLRQRILRD